jgi:cytochrome c-type biogenesis protein CcmH
MFWLFAALMVAVAGGLLVRPLLHARPAVASRTDYDLAVYRDQLAEVDGDMARGVLVVEQAAAARLEIERRILVAADDTERIRQPTSPMTRSPSVAALLAIALPLAALALYLPLGSPWLPGQPLVDRAPSSSPSDAQNHTDIGALVTQLATRMAATPDDPKGWTLLGRTYKMLGRYAEAADAYAKAIAHGAVDAGTYAAYGEMLTMAANGQVTAAALQAFQTALAVDPKEPRARYYQAVARSQAGDP